MTSLRSHFKTELSENTLKHSCSLDIKLEPFYVRLTGIVCTIGPASRSLDVLEKMFASGMNIARLNFSHGTHEYHAESIKNLRIAANNYNQKNGTTQPLAIALDTKGSEIRTGLLEGGGSSEVELIKGETIKLTTDKQYINKGNKNIIYVDYTNITKVVKEGSKIYIDDGLLCLICESVDSQILTCTIENGGKLGSCKGVNIPGIIKDLPTISEKDKKDIRFAIDQNLDIIFASFTRNAQEVEEIREILGEKGKQIKVVAKIENQEGMEKMDEIIEASDGILIDRGDLGMEITFQKVFIAQKAVIARCNKVGKPVIIATHLLESMIQKPRPTRAESSDVANAVLDGADCVMLSGETAKGDYPVECVRTMADICREAEAVIWQKQLFANLIDEIIPPIDVTQTIAITTVQAASNSLASAIIVTTRTGKSAELISKYRPKCPIIAITENAQVTRQLHLHRAILPVHYEEEVAESWRKDMDNRIEAGINFGKSQGFIKSGDIIILVTGWKKGPGATNSMSTVYVE